MDATNIYHGPVSKIEISDDNTLFSDLGAVGKNNAEITFDPVADELGDKQEVQLYGLGKIRVDIAETHAVNIALVKAATQQYIKVTALNAKTYLVGPIFLKYGTKRGFADEAHILSIMGQKAAVDEDGFGTIA